jgi:hypothetical protein
VRSLGRQNTSSRYLEASSRFAELYLEEKQLPVGNTVTGGATGGGGWNTPPTRQQIGKLSTQSAKLDWLKITTEETKIHFLNNLIQTEYHE